jgi:hypothetical protein
MLGKQAGEESPLSSIDHSENELNKSLRFLLKSRGESLSKEKRKQYRGKKTQRLTTKTEH